MSHVTTITSVPLKDIKAIRNAVEDLKAKGIDIELLENAIPRLWNDAQSKATGPCEFVLKLGKIRFDVGLKAKKDENSTAETYKMLMDQWDDLIRSQIGVKEKVKGENATLAAVGQFTQAYAKHAAINAAVNAGHHVRACTTDQKGNVQLVFAGYR